MTALGLLNSGCDRQLVADHDIHPLHIGHAIVSCKQEIL